MKSQRIAWIVCALALFRATPSLAAGCDVSAKLPANTRIFAQTSDKSPWREYQTMAKVHEVDGDEGGQVFHYWQEQGGGLAAYAEEGGEDFAIYTRYCFGADGRLQHVSFEFRTAWGWGYRLEGAVTGDVLHRLSSRYFDTNDERTIPRPETAGDVSDSMKPILYLRTNKLPFAALLSRSHR